MIIFILLLSTLFFALLVYSFYYFLKLYEKRNQDFLSELQRVQIENEKKILTKQIEMVEKTYENISREIHDNIGQKLSIAKLHLHTMEENNTVPDNIRISSTLKLITSAIVEIGDISRTLNSEFVAFHGLKKILEIEVQQLQRTRQFKISFKTSGEAVFLAPLQEVFLFRIVQEALNNIIKHSKATTIHFQLDYNEENIHLSIADNGKGFDKNSPKHLPGTGLSNISKRAEVIDADCQIESVPNQGTIITVKLPYDKKAQKN